MDKPTPNEQQLSPYGPIDEKQNGGSVETSGVSHLQTSSGDAKTRMEEELDGTEEPQKGCEDTVQDTGAEHVSVTEESEKMISKLELEVKQLKISLDEARSTSTAAAAASSSQATQPNGPTTLQLITEIIPLPTKWTRMDPDKMLEKVPLNPQDTEYVNVVQNFTSSIGDKYSVKEVMRIQNPELYRKYMVNLEYMAARNGTAADQTETFLWHGTNSDAIDGIVMNGFNRSYCGKNGDRWGNGANFAVDAIYSSKYSRSDANGRKYLLLCRVLPGQYTKAYNGMNVAPYRDAENWIHYDSATDDVESPSLFVVFADNQAFPEYVVVFD